MADVPVENVAALQILTQASQGPQMVNTCYLRLDAGWSGAALDSILGAVEAAWTDTLANVTSDSVTFVGARIRDIGTSPYGVIREALVDTAVPGEVTGDPFPYFACAVVQLIGDSGGEPRRSYLRHGGLAESQASGNAMVAVQRTAIAQQWSAFLDAISDPVPLSANVIVSRYDNNAPRVEGVSNTLQGVLVRQALGRATSRAGLHA